MSDDPVMAMHEAQAVAMEKQQEIDRLKREKEELVEKLNGNEDGLDEKLNREKEDLEKKLRKLCKYFGIPLILGCLIICAVVFLILYTTKRKFTSETILIMGGWKNNTKDYAGMAVLSQNRTKSIEIELELPDEAFKNGAIYLNGEIYLIGGLWNPKALYKLDKNLKWIRLADMNVGRRGIENNCLEWNGNIWVFGGADGYKHLKSVERYDSKKNKWTLMADMKEARTGAAATLWNNKIIICGGWIEKFTITNSAECYNPEYNSWIEFTPLPEPLRGHSLVTYENKLILFGGWDGKEATNVVWELDPQESNPKWNPLPPMKYPSTYFAGKILDQEIYAIGGVQVIGLDSSRVEIFDGERWRDGAALPYSWAGMSSVIIPQTLADRLSQYKKE